MKKFQELNLCDDFLFKVVMRDEKQYIIFVCTGDPFGEGLYKYTFTNRCREIPDLELGDGTVKVFLNTKGSKGEVSDELKAFLSFVEKSTVQNAATIKDSYVAKLSAKIEDIKRNEEIGGAFMTIEEKMEELARESANAKALEIAQKMKTEGFSFDQIVQLTGLTQEEIENL